MRKIHAFECPYLGQFVTSYLIETDSHNVFIDTGIKSFEDRLIPYLENGKKNIVLLTHGHWDHIGGDETAKRYGAEIFASRKDLPWLTDFELHWDIGFGQFMKDIPIPPERKDVFWQEIGSVVMPDRFVEPGEELAFGELKIRAVPLPGHSAGCLGYYLPDDDILFTGDALMETGFFGGLAQYCDPELYIGSMKRIAELDPALVYTGHTAPYRDHSAKEAAVTAIRFAEKIAEDLMDILHETEGDILVGETAEKLCRKEGKRLTGGACITVINHLSKVTDPELKKRISLDGYHVGV